MKYLSLGEVAEFIRGVTFKPTDIVEFGTMNSVVCMRTKNVQKDLDESDLLSIDKSFVKNDKKNLQEGDLLVSTANSFELVGKACWVPKLDYPATAGGFISILRADPAVLYPRYLYHWITTGKVQHILRYCGRQTTNISNMDFDRARKVKIPLPALEEQKQIAAILDKADAIRRKRRKAIEMTDQLLKSVFLEMFGDPVENTKAWELHKFSDVSTSRLGKMLDAKQQTGEHQQYYLRNPNVQWNKIVLTDLQKMDFNEKDRNEFQLKYGDVLICEGGEVGRAAIWRNEMDNCYFQKALHRVRPNTEIVTSEYLCDLMWFYAKYGGLTDYVSSATIAHLTGAKLKNMEIPIPPIELQKKYIEITEKHRTYLDKNISADIRFKDLINSLTQRAFKGELTIQTKAA